MSKGKTVVISVGGNLKETPCAIKSAILLLARISSFITVSSLYLTSPWGGKTKMPFFNAVVVTKCSFSPITLLTICKEIEFIKGRRVGEVWGDRILDLDILLYSNLRITTEILTLPHPSLGRRNYLIAPLRELLPFYEDIVPHYLIDWLIGKDKDYIKRFVWKCV